MADDGHDPTNPDHVTRELMKPFPQNALYHRDGRTYVQYQQVIRRLVHATGNRFSTTVVSVTEKPWGTSKRGVEQVLIEATVSLTIPVLDSTRTHTGVQVASVGFGEDMRKGAVSDALKKAAQQFGVAIDLAGADGEDTAPESETTQRAPARISERQTLRTAAETDTTDYSTDQQWQAASRTLHATAAAKVGQQQAHDLTHLLALRGGSASLKFMPVVRLLKMNEYLRSAQFETDFQNGIEAELAEIALAAAK